MHIFRDEEVAKTDKEGRHAVNNQESLFAAPQATVVSPDSSRADPDAHQEATLRGPRGIHHSPPSGPVRFSPAKCGKVVCPRQKKIHEGDRNTERRDGYLR